MMDLIGIVGAIIILVVYLIDRYYLKKQISGVTMEKEVKEAVLSLFLYAEKQGWPSGARMTYVYHKIDDIIPGAVLDKVIGEERLSSFLQRLYEEFKTRLYK